jgi:hypothetical protein
MKVVDDELISEFLKYGGYGLYIEDLPMDQLTELRLMMKAAIAKNIWGFDAYVSMLLNEDPVLKEVIKLSSRTLQ